MTVTYDFSGLRAVITGGASGIGLATAERFLASGAQVVLWDSNRDLVAKQADRQAVRWAVGPPQFRQFGELLLLLNDIGMNSTTRLTGCLTLYIDVYVDQNCMLNSESSTFSCGWYARTVRAVLFGGMRKIVEGKTGHGGSARNLAIISLPENWP